MPAATEIVALLNAEDLLVGRSHECDYPASVKSLPACTTTQINSNASSAEIDTMVKEHHKNALSLYQVNWESLRLLQPDLIITQEQCDVCAIKYDDLMEGIRAELGYTPTVLSLKPSVLADVMDDIKRIGEHINRKAEALTLLEDMQSRLDIIEHKLRFAKYRPSIVMIEWIEPLMVAGHWSPELLTIAGGIPALSKIGARSFYINMDDLEAADPDGIVIAACGFDLAKSEEEYKQLEQDARWQNLKAVQKGHVFICDGNQFFNRPGPRLVDSAEILAEILQLNQFYYGFENIFWKQMPAFKSE